MNGSFLATAQQASSAMWTACVFLPLPPNDGSYGLPLPRPVRWHWRNSPPHATNVPNHIFICPRLFTFQWRRQLYHLADIIFEVPPGVWTFWPSSMHEPLVIGLTLCFHSTSPWLLKFHPTILELVRTLRQVWPSMPGTERHILRQLCDTLATLEPV
jgi:hypothetical protein